MRPELQVENPFVRSHTSNLVGFSYRPKSVSDDESGIFLLPTHTENPYINGQNYTEKPYINGRNKK